EEDLSEGLLRNVIVRLYGDHNNVLTLLGELVRFSRRRGNAFVCGVRLLPEGEPDLKSWLFADGRAQDGSSAASGDDLIRTRKR
ncbi:MAG TPA: hypothetical protein VFG95_09750, partial [Nitrospiria bacterium]|nr:hypothetical protein [Nitrospiria bacterium]